MTDYSQITDAEIDQDSPARESLFAKLRNNVLSMFENDETAVSAGVGAHGLWTLDTDAGTDGLLYDGDVDGSVTSISSGTFTDGYDYMLVLDEVFIASDNSSASVEAHYVTSDEWVSKTLVTTGVETHANYRMYGEVKILNPSLSSRGHVGTSTVERPLITSNTTSTSEVSVIHWRKSTAEKIDAIRLERPGSDTFSGGKVWLYRSISKLAD